MCINSYWLFHMSIPTFMRVRLIIIFFCGILLFNKPIIARKNIAHESPRFYSSHSSTFVFRSMLQTIYRLYMYPSQPASQPTFQPFISFHIKYIVLLYKCKTNNANNKTDGNEREQQGEIEKEK